MALSGKQTLMAFAGICALMIAMHGPVITEPPRSIHTWRQCHTLAVAQNFYEEDMNILRPRVDRRGHLEGVTGMQFPAYEYALALSYHLFGTGISVHRVLSLMITVLSMLALYRIAMELWNNRVISLCGSVILAWSPDLFYHSANALPDILALCAGLWGFAGVLRWRSKPSTASFLYSILLFTLAGLTKIQFLSMAVPLAVLILQDLRRKQIDKRTFLHWAIAAVAGSVLVLLWYAYAGFLRKQSGLTDFGLHINPVLNLKEAFRILWDNLSSHIPETLIGYASFTTMLIGIGYGLRVHTGGIWRVPYIIWLLTLTIYHCLELGQMKDHTYYMMPYLLPAWLAALYGIRQITVSRKWVPLALLLVLAQVPLTYLRMSERWRGSTEYVPQTLYQKQSRELLRNVTPHGIPVVGPDHSGSIYFYYLNLAGFGFGDPEDLFRTTNGKTNLDLWIEQGAGSLYTDNPTLKNDPRFLPYVDSTFACVGDFCVYRLQMK